MTMRKQRVVQAAEKLVQRGRLEAAIGEYRKVLVDAPDDTRTLNRVGDLYLRLGRVDEAVDLFSRAAKHFSREGFFVKAIAIYKKIIRVDPTRIAIYESLADLYHRQGLQNEARSQYQVVADYHAQNDDHEAVISIHRKMVDLDPEDPSQRLRLADLHLKHDNRQEAMKQYQQIAELMIAHQRYGEATRVYLKAVEIDPDDLAFLADAVLGLKDRGQDVSAEQLLQKAAELNPEAEKVRGMAGLAEVEPEPEAAVEEAAEEAAEETAPAPVETPAEPEAAPEEMQVIDLTEAIADLTEPEVEELPAAAPEELVEFEIKLDELELEEIGAAPADETVEAPPGVEELAEEAQDFLRSRAVEPEPTAEELEARRAEHALELMAEAQVLAAYGLDEKAVERFEQVLEVEPGNLEAFRRLVELHLHEGRTEQVATVYQRAYRSVARTADEQGWSKLLDLLEQEGYHPDGERLGAPEPVVEEPEPVAEAPAAAPPTPSEAPEPEPAVTREPAPEIPAAEEVPVEESAITWLEELRVDAGEAGDESRQMFGEEEEFFDLAAELEEELEQEEKQLREQMRPPTEEQSLEEIVAGFKQGVAETLSQEDYDTHYNLGIAYREMGLLDEAIGEFQLAAKDPRYLVDCCSLLGASFLEKGFGDLAVKWYRRGLESPEISEDETLGLLYELGNLFVALDDRERALKTFVEIYGVNSNYRDVVAKLEELRAAP